MLIDTHCHVQFKSYAEDREEMLKRCQDKDMRLITVGTQASTSKAAIKLAEQHEFMFASVGLHPIQEHDTEVEEETTKFRTVGEEFDMDVYREMAKHPKVVAIGETGLDRFHVPKDKTTEEILDKQAKTFLKHYEIAKEFDLPLVIHVRDAHADMIVVLETLPRPIRGVIHCFSGNREQAEKYIEFGLHLGIGGVITFPPRKTDPEATLSLLDAVTHAPMDRLVLETDAPFLAPQPYRGTRAEPWMAEAVAEKVAALRGITKEEVITQTTENAKRLFTKMT